MAYKIQIGKSAFKRLIWICEYIAANWGFRVAGKFYDKFENRAKQILKYPEIGRPSKKQFQYRRITVAKRNIIYYRITDAAIIIEKLYDSRADPEMNPYD